MRPSGSPCHAAFRKIGSGIESFDRTRVGGIQQLTEEAKSMGAVMSQESLEALAKFDDSMQRLKSGGEAAKNALGMVLLPQLQILADDGVSLWVISRGG